MTNKRVTTPRTETQTPSPLEMHWFMQRVRARIGHKIETMEARARQGFIIDLVDLQIAEDLLNMTDAALEQLRSEALGSSAPPSIPSRCGH